MPTRRERRLERERLETDANHKEREDYKQKD